MNCELLLRIGGVRISGNPYLNLTRWIRTTYKSALTDPSNQDVYRERNTVFPILKANTFRVFCLNGSASAVWPHLSKEIHSRHLQCALEQVYPAGNYRSHQGQHPCLFKPTGSV